MVIFTGTFVDGFKSGYGKELYDREGKIFYEGGWAYNLKSDFGKEWY